MFVNGVTLEPVPPVVPVAMGKSTRGVEFESSDDLDERQIAAWMKQTAAMPGVRSRIAASSTVTIARGFAVCLEPWV